MFIRDQHPKILKNIGTIMHFMDKYAYYTKNVRQIAKNVKQITSVAAKSAMSAVGRNDMRMGL